ncbi:hypothetical protein VSR68_01605 [Paraburkholderia phymatum]|uniref:hypothetical protein n=1 Tax=Paraburkholderia phymatum TaxID=148447 RepID=UPI00317D64DE
MKSDSFNSRVMRESGGERDGREANGRRQRTNDRETGIKPGPKAAEKNNETVELVRTRVVFTDVVPVCSAGFLSVRA